VLELFGLLVNVVPRDADDIGEEALDHPVSRDDVLGVAPPFQREVNRTAGIALDVAVALEAPQHLVHRRRRELHRARQVRTRHRQACLKEPKKAFEVLLLGCRRMLSGHAMIVAA